MGTEGEKYFELVADIVSTRHKIGDGFACPCCSTPSFLEAGCWEICDNCGWEDDPVQERQTGSTIGANGISLELARKNYASFGWYKEKPPKRVLP